MVKLLIHEQAKFNQNTSIRNDLEHENLLIVEYISLYYDVGKHMIHKDTSILDYIDSFKTKEEVGLRHSIR